MLPKLLGMSVIKKNDAFAALRYPEFRYFISSQFFFTLAIQIQSVILSFYLYDITSDPLSLGLVGLFIAVPYISLALFGGYLADKYDKRSIAQICFVAVMLSTLILVWGLNGTVGLPKYLHSKLIYANMFIYGVARGFYNPAWSALRPYLVKPEHYANSATWNTQFWQTGLIVGPSSAGFLYAYLGLQNSLWIVFCMLFLVLLLSTKIKKRTIEKRHTEPVFKSVLEGFKFVKNEKLLFYSIYLDMLTVLFGGVIAILPVFAKDILFVGAEGLGILRAAPGIGAVVTMFFLAYFKPTHHAWRNMLIATLGFGITTLIFALSVNLYLSIFALFLTGVFDSISVVIRTTILQATPPEHLRGRVTAVNGIFVSASNELGALESGLAAKLLGTVPSVIFGGTMTIGVVSYIYNKTKELFKIKLDL